MKLRNQLFLSGSALLTVALIGLLLGMFSVLLLTKAQTQAMERNLQIIDATIGLRQELGRQVILMLGENLDKEALQDSDQRFRQWLQEARDGAMNDTDRQAVGEIEQAYALFDDNLQQPLMVRRALLENDEFASSLEAIRKRLDDVQIRYVDAVKNSQSNARERAWQIVGLLAFIGLAVLFIGFITAHSIAQRFAHPIEALAGAADQIGKGDFQVTLPLSPVAELAALSRRFGLMAEALRQFKNTNVQALMAEQQRLQAVLDSIDDGLLIFNRTGLLEHVNPVARRQLGWQDEPLGRSPGDAFNSPMLDEQLQQVLHGENLQNVTEELKIEADSETRLLSYSLTPVTLDDAQLHGAVMVLRDVTEQRAFERVRSEFVLRASHELRTPVTGMHMAFALLQERLSFAPQAREADLLRTVDEEMHRLVRLINDLLNFSRYQNGLQKLDLAPCDLDELLNQTRQRFQAQAEENEITLLVDVHEPVPRLHLDRLQIERVLDNLVGNALRHSYPNGEIRLQARVQDERVILSVEDTGEGIPYSQQTRVFEPFVQVGRKKGGAGLGLALCKEIVQLHGGRIGVHSKPGQGTQFYLALPV